MTYRIWRVRRVRLRKPPPFLERLATSLVKLCIVGGIVDLLLLLYVMHRFFN